MPHHPPTHNLICLGSRQLTPSILNGICSDTFSCTAIIIALISCTAIGSNDRQEFLEPGEAIIMISKVKKIQKLTNKKVQLILTDKPKLICVDPSKMATKGNVLWSDDPSNLSIHVTSSSHFKISSVSFFFFT